MKYLCREEILAEGAQLMRRTIELADTSGWRVAGEALQAWQQRHRPSENEVRAVLRMINNRYV